MWVLFRWVSYSCLWQGSDGTSEGDSIKMAEICTISCVCCRDKGDNNKCCGGLGGETGTLYSCLI